MFGMGTGVTPSLVSPGIFNLRAFALSKLHSNLFSLTSRFSYLWLSLRLISISPLNASQHLHS